MPSESEHEEQELFFEPVVTLPPVTISNSEENEDCLFQQRAQLFRFDTVEDPPEWKERGVGILKILRHKTSGCYRLLMRRDRTFKVCANHFILDSMQLRPNCGSTKAFVWSTLADYADEVVKPESLGIRFANEKFAEEFQKLFEEGRQASVGKCTDKKPSRDSHGGDTGSLKEDESADIHKLSNTVKECLKINTGDSTKNEA
uniref:RanBD1 domain-containing protein n=1 Tax=Trichobilharzia regenti TaxID=157069 RepID=A0AA85JY40_TRIRE|nr:unnamed protein product [Trichobilharzia regenti]